LKRTLVVEGELRLTGGRCAACGHMTIPIRRVCPACGNQPVAETTYGPRGTVENWVDLQVSTDAYQAPYQVGFVTLNEGPRLFTRLESVRSRDQAVRLAGEPDRDTYWFVADRTTTPIGGQG
jgi:uncharacterized protein